MKRQTFNKGLIFSIGLLILGFAFAGAASAQEEGLPDLTVLDFGDIFPFFYNILNQGSAPALPPWRDVVFLSNDSILDAEDQIVGCHSWIGYPNPTQEDPSSPLYPGEIRNIPIELNLPPDMSYGEYYLILKLDQADNIDPYHNYLGNVMESDEGNNFYYSQAPLTIPDLVVTSLSHSDVTSNFNNILVAYTVTNPGAAATKPWQDMVYLSNDNILDSSDLAIGSHSWNEILYQGDSRTISINVTLPLGITPDSQHLIVKADYYNDIVEYDEQNNVLSEAFVLPDFVVTGIDAPLSAKTEQQISLSWTVEIQNLGIEARWWQDELYVSMDDQLGPADPLLATAQHFGPIPAGESYTVIERAIIPSLPPGNYYLIVKIDTGNMVYENRESNNLFSKLFTIIETSQESGFSETFSDQSTMDATILSQKFSLAGGTVVGDMNGTFDLNKFEIITVRDGAFAEKGFSKEEWIITFEGVSYQGVSGLTNFYVPSENKVYLKGAIMGEGASGIVEGYLIESIPGNGVFDKYHATWQLGRLGDVSTSTTLILDGTVTNLEEPQELLTKIYVLQTSAQGNTSGHYEENLSVVLTNVRIADEANPFNGQGFCVISYDSEFGSGQGWAYSQVESPGVVMLNGLFTKPLMGMVSGAINENTTPKTLILNIERVDLVLPPMADLEVEIWGPKWVSPGQWENYIIEYRNDGIKAADNVVVVIQLPYEAEYLLSTGGGIYKLDTREVIWKLGTVQPKTKGNLVVTVRVQWGISSEALFKSAAIIDTTSDEIDRYTTGAPSLCGISDYLEYQPSESSKGRFEIGAPSEIDNLIQDTQFLDIYNYAKGLGFEDGNTILKIIYDNGASLKGPLMVSSTTTEFYWAVKFTGQDQKNTSFLIKIGEDFTSFFDKDGGLEILSDGSSEVWGAHYSCAYWACKSNCIAKKVPAMLLGKAVNGFRCAWNIAWSGSDCTQYPLIPKTETEKKERYRTACLASLGRATLGCSKSIPGLGDILGGSLGLWTCTLDCNEKKAVDPSWFMCVPGATKGECGGFLRYADSYSCNEKCQWKQIARRDCQENCQNGWCAEATDMSYSKCVNPRDCMKKNPPNSSSHTQRIFIAHDPNIKYGHEGNVLPGQKLDYRVEYENEGEGIAFGVYFTDTLEEDVDDTTLSIGPVIDVKAGVQIGAPGIYNPNTRTITWFTGEVGSGQGGYAEFSVKAKNDLPDGTEIINFATVYFPSVPEETRTNGIVSIVNLYHPPVANANGPYIGNEGSSIIFDASQSYDANSDILQYRWDFNNDDAWDTEWSTTSASSAYTWADDYTGTAKLEVSDGKLTATDTASVIVNNESPISSATNDGPKNEGTSVTVTASQADPGADTFTYSFDWNNDGIYEIVDLANPSAQYTYTDDGVYTVGVMVRDDDEGIGTATTDVIIVNVAPTIEAGSDQTINEGETVSFNGSFIDPGADTFAILWEFGDGNTAIGTLAPTHTYKDNGVYKAALLVQDDNGGTGVDTLTVTVNNVLPIVGTITVPTDPISVGTPVNLSVTFTDEGTNDTHVAVWNLDDGNTSPGIINEIDGSGSTNVSYAYPAAGIYAISVTVTDDDKGSGQSVAQQYLVVYNPEGDYITGGGWIDSPAGAYGINTSLTGKANFGFNSKYQKGANVPTGETEFNLKVASMNFHSSDYEWLVVAGANAKYKGIGTINNAGDYGFMLTATDGQANGKGETDKFRIKIWDKATEAIVYDNKMGVDDDSYDAQTINGGSIVIHKK